MRVLFIVLVVSLLAVVGVAAAVYIRVRKRVDAHDDEHAVSGNQKGEDNG